MAQHKRDIYGYTVYGEDDTIKGMDYLDHDLQTSEAKVFFDQAFAKGKADFEDDEERQFTLLYDRSAGRYSIVHRKVSSGWW